MSLYGRTVQFITQNYGYKRRSALVFGLNDDVVAIPLWISRTQLDNLALNANFNLARNPLSDKSQVIREKLRLGQGHLSWRYVAGIVDTHKREVQRSLTGFGEQFFDVLEDFQIDNIEMSKEIRFGKQDRWSSQNVERDEA